MLQRLPPEVQEKIFNELKVGDLQNLACCSYNFDDLLKEYLWASVKIKKKDLLDQNCFNRTHLKNLRHAQILHIVSHAHKEDERKLISKSFSKVLKYCNPKILHAYLPISEVLGGIINMCNLTALYLDGTSINDSDVITVSNTMISLKSLSIRMTNITDHGLISLHNLTVLEVLDLGATKISQNAFQHLKQLTHLMELYFDKCPNIQNSTFVKQLSSLNSLCILNISSSRVNDDGAAALASLSKLRELNLSYSYNALTGRLFGKYQDLQQLTKLQVSWCAITDANLPFIASISSLQYLDLRQNPITDEGVKELQGHQLLQHLDISGCWDVSDQSVCCLFTMVQLTWLGVSGTKVTSYGMGMLGNIMNDLMIVKRY